MKKWVPIITPQRRNRGSKQWVSCLEHQATRFAITKSDGGAVISAFPNKSAALQVLGRMLRSSVKPDRLATPQLGQRYPEGQIQVYARSLTQCEYQQVCKGNSDA